MSFSRDASLDKIIYPSSVVPTYYTATSAITTGDILYDDEGMDTGFAISTIDQSNKFTTNSTRYVYAGWASGNLVLGKYVISTKNDLSLMTVKNTKLLMSPFSDKVTNVKRIEVTQDVGITWYTFVGEIGGSITVPSDRSVYATFDAATQPLALRDWNFTFYPDAAVVEYLLLPGRSVSVWDSSNVDQTQTTSHCVSIVNFITSLYIAELQIGVYNPPLYAHLENMVNVTINTNTGEIAITDLSQPFSFRIRMDSVCLTGDTLVTMFDKSVKRLDEIEVGDKVLCINTDTLELDEDEVIFTDKDKMKKHTCYDVWNFSEGYQVKTVHRHRFYNMEDNSFTYMDRWNIGDHTINQEGKRLELLSHETVEEEVRHYKITTKKYHNYFANGMLTGSRLTKNFDCSDLKLEK